MSFIFSTGGPAAGATAPPSEILNTIAKMCQAFQGSGTLLDALREISNLTGAEVATLSRVDVWDTRAAPQVLSHDACLTRFKTTEPFNYALAPVIVGKHMLSARAGSVWFYMCDDLDGDDVVVKKYASRRLSESASILLERKNGKVDFLELHFCLAIPTGLLRDLEVLGPILADQWKNRSLGRFTEAKLARTRKTPVRKAPRHILSIENPYGLSRSEYRVCALLARGLNNTALLEELSITMPTLRTHLRNIYMKTGNATQIELIYDLLDSAAQSRSLQFGRSHVA